ncbi:MAG: hypothetical protein ACLTYN_02760 [Dysosmobacter welbionis]
MTGEDGDETRGGAVAVVQVGTGKFWPWPLIPPMISHIPTEQHLRGSLQ